MNRRGSGLILHITSLPSPFGIGDLGPGAYRAVDFMHRAGQAFWQILPLTPTSGINGHSPYSSISAFAGNTLLISPELLAEDGLISLTDLPQAPADPSTVDYTAAEESKQNLVHMAHAALPAYPGLQDEFHRFCLREKNWLDDFALFCVAKEACGRDCWNQWPRELRDRDAQALDDLARERGVEIERIKFGQFLFFRQWAGLKKYTNHKGIQIIGDLPIYVSFDSAEVWAQPEQFKLDEQGTPVTVAGVPPDYFSSTGQLWGNPVYDWERMEDTGFAWWIQRLQHTFSLYDIVRIDHFRGFVGYWEVPYAEETAVNGWWTEAPAIRFFRTLLTRFPCLPIIAEDLGEITPDVREVMHLFNFPGMKVLVFAFYEDNPLHPFLPHTYERNCVAYTGTHDTNTVLGWLQNETDQQTRQRLYRYLGRELPDRQVPWELVRLAMGSVADKAVFPLQDLLGLNADSRMNLPSTTQANWAWRARPEELSPDLADALADMAAAYGRT
ncbi:4-alpha-glucanotransferase [Desulfovermiculus halophilus]|uniref:4-alpha-glucanotransferase n=1 Tax=Desulfovermiculus halophilus TaxID=339722 RepID=UPI00047F16EB|nr:4-alpha-glucanotransferase [Desulfovermiculus halophilus]